MHSNCMDTVCPNSLIFQTTKKDKGIKSSTDISTTFYAIRLYNTVKMVADVLHWKLVLQQVSFDNLISRMSQSCVPFSLISKFLIDDLKKFTK